MAIVECKFGNHIKRVEAANPHILLTNHKGDYLALGHPNLSNYHGLFWQLPHEQNSNHHVKALYSIGPKSGQGAKQALPMRVEANNVIITRQYETCKDQFALSQEGMLYAYDGSQPVQVTLDCKHLYDESDQGRIYSVTAEQHDSSHLLVIHYKKYSDHSLANLQYEFFVAVAANSPCTLLQQWREASYEYDQRRGTKSTPYVFDLCTIEPQVKGSSNRESARITIAVSQTMQEATMQALELLRTYEDVLKNIVSNAKAREPRIPQAALPAWRALDQLIVEKAEFRGIMAGLPWFFQHWSRDELISLGAIIATKQYDLAISIIGRWHAAAKDGRIHAMYPNEGNIAKDAPGWLAKRTRDLLIALAGENRLRQAISESQLVCWRDSLGNMIDSIAKESLCQRLIWTGENETWMDTAWNDDGRQGARIEIQALFLTLYDAYAHLCTLTKERVRQERASVAQAVKEAVVKKMVVDGRLLDGLHKDGTPDMRARPNIFLAWHIAPGLFNNREWQGFFDHALQELWLDWGGLASIAKSDPSFTDHYTGESKQSYHRGDSWLYLNNIAALAMHSVSKERYAQQIRMIWAAGEHDLFALGFSGGCSEVSSAGKQDASGCWAQAWSASTLVELLLKE